MSGTLDIRRDGQIALVTLSNPAKRNALSATMLDTLRTFAAETAPDRAVRAVIICGEGTTFSAGADIGGFDAPGGGSRAANYDPLLEDTLAALEALPQPTIAAIAGPCMGAGTALAAACDFRVAEESAFFAIPAARLGLATTRKAWGASCAPSATRQRGNSFCWPSAFPRHVPIPSAQCTGSPTRAA